MLFLRKHWRRIRTPDELVKPQLSPTGFLFGLKVVFPSRP
jgi:hypothetical protein